MSDVGGGVGTGGVGSFAKPIFYYARGTSYIFNFLGATISLAGQTDLTIFGFWQIKKEIPVDAALGWVKGINPGEYYLWNDYDPFPDLLDQSLWNTKKVPYPASTAFMGPSIEDGVNWIINDLKSKPIGTPFALGGYSQGAAVMSRVYNECRNGVLRDRRADLRAMVTFGNPMREVGHTYPGSSGYSGACDINGDTKTGSGVFPTLDAMDWDDWFVSRFSQLQNTEPFVWDFTMPNEVISGVGQSDDGKFMKNFTHDSLRQFPIAVLLSSDPANPLNFGIGPGTRYYKFMQYASSFGVAPPGVPANESRSVMLTDAKTGEIGYLPGGGHVMYPFYPPPLADGTIPTSGDTCYQIAAKYLNRVGAAIYDEQHPTVPEPTSSPTLQWFSSLPNG